MQNSQVQPIYVASQINITGFSTQNTSPSILNYPGSNGMAGTQFFYNPACNDSDGDSLSYVLTNCSGAGYYMPASATINNSGLFSFYTDTVGLYSFSFIVKEWRKNTSSVYATIGSTQLDFLVGITTSIGINEFKKEPELRIYPNPVTNELRILHNNTVTENYVAEIINNLGQVVLKTGSADIINISDLPTGFYVLNLNCNNNIPQSFKFIKE